MTPSAPLPRDPRPADRPPPRDPQAAGAPANSEAPQSSPEDAFAKLVDEAEGKEPVPAEKSANAPEDPAEQKDETNANAASAAASMPVALNQPQPPMPPSSPSGTENQNDKGSPHERAKAGKIQPAQLTSPDATKTAFEPAEPKKRSPSAAGPHDSFSALVSDSKTPEPSALPQQPATASPRPLEPTPAPPPPTSAQAPLPVAALPAAIAIKALDGVNRFDIQLSPEDLGRIDVSLEIDQDGAIRAAITADKPEALQLIVREARALEQAFDQAGFRRDDNALSFNLSGESGFARDGNNPNPQTRTGSTRFFVEGETELPPALATILHSAQGRLDMRI